MIFLLQSNTGMPYVPESHHHKALTSDSSYELRAYTTAPDYARRTTTLTELVFVFDTRSYYTSLGWLELIK